MVLHFTLKKNHIQLKIQYDKKIIKIYLLLLFREKKKTLDVDKSNSSMF